MLYINRNDDGIGAVDDVIPERQRMALLLDRDRRSPARARTDSSSRSANPGVAPLGGQLGDLRPVVQAGLQDAADDRQVEFAGAQQQPGEQVEAGVPAEVAHRGRVALAHLDQAGRRQRA